MPGDSRLGKAELGKAAAPAAHWIAHLHKLFRVLHVQDNKLYQLWTQGKDAPVALVHLVACPAFPFQSVDGDFLAF